MKEIEYTCREYEDENCSIIGSVSFLNGKVVHAEIYSNFIDKNDIINVREFLNKIESLDWLK